MSQQPDHNFAPPDFRLAAEAERDSSTPPAPPAPGETADALAPRRPGLLRRNSSAETNRSIRILITGLITLILAGVVGVGAVGVFLAKTDSLPLQVTQASYARVSQLQIGHCLRTLPVDGRISTVVAVPCNATHKAQVISEWTVEPAANALPDVAALMEIGTKKCESTALQSRPADATFVVWLPTEAGWKDGDRRALCLVQAPTLTRSLLPA